MSVVTLTFVASQDQITSGIPVSVTIHSNILATIYYTIDGTTPTTNSNVASGPVNFPTGVDSVILSAFGVDAYNDVSPTLTHTYAADETRITRTRLVGQEGDVLQRDGTNPEFRVGFNADGYAATFMNFDPQLIDMEKTHSDRGGEGAEGGFTGTEPGTAVFVGFPDPTTDESERYERFVPFSTTNGPAELFDPEARFILINTKEPHELNPTLRTYESLENVYREFGGKRLLNVADDACYVSGGFVRRFYNPATNTQTSYYYDHNESRWVKDIQPFFGLAMPTNGIGVASDAKFPLIFPWIYRGRQSGII